MQEQTAQKLLAENQRLYTLVAEEFANTRKGKYQSLIPLGKFAHDGDRVLDAGCGTGRLFEIFKNRTIEFLGIDTSEKMAALAKKQWEHFPRAQFQKGELFEIPFPDHYFDVVYAIAAFHHIPGLTLRKKTLQEFRRVLKPGGRLVMTNWYYWSGLALFTILKYWLKKLLGADLDFGDIFVPWGKKGMRYYHSFRKKELTQLLHAIGFKNIKQCLRRGRNDYFGKRTNLITTAEK